MRTRQAGWQADEIQVNFEMVNISSNVCINPVPQILSLVAKHCPLLDLDVKLKTCKCRPTGEENGRQD